MTWWLGRLTYALTCMAFVCAGVGCDRPPSQLVVVVDSDLRVPEELETIRAEVLDPRKEIVSFQELALTDGVRDDTRFSLPLSFGVVPRSGDTDRTVLIRVTGLDRDRRTVVTRRARTGFLPEESLLLPMFLARRCVEARCEPDQTCTENGCASVDVPPDELSRVEPGEELERDGGVDRDGGRSDGGSEDGGDPDGGIADGGGNDGGPIDAGSDAGGCTTSLEACGTGSSACECTECACALTCDGDCNASCRDARTCHIDGRVTSNFVAECEASTCDIDAYSSSNAEVDCSDGAVCEIDCGRTSNCEVRCDATSECQLRCDGSSNCGFTSCAGEVSECAGNVRVCNGGCP